MRYFLKELLEPIAYFVYTILLLLTYRAKKRWPYKMMACYYAFAVVMLLIATWENSQTPAIISNYNYNLMFLVATCVVTTYYYWLCQQPQHRRFIRWCGIANLCLFVITDIFGGMFNTYNKYTYGFLYISIISYSLIYFREVLGNISEKNVLHHFDFWLVCSGFFYSLGAFVIVVSYLDVDPSINGELWGVQSIVLFTSSFLTLYGYIAMRRNT